MIPYDCDGPRPESCLAPCTCTDTVTGEEIEHDCDGEFPDACKHQCPCTNAQTGEEVRYDCDDGPPPECEGGEPPNPPGGSDREWEWLDGEEDPSHPETDWEAAKSRLGAAFGKLAPPGLPLDGIPGDAGPGPGDVPFFIPFRNYTTGELYIPAEQTEFTFDAEFSHDNWGEMGDVLNKLRQMVRALCLFVVGVHFLRGVFDHLGRS